MGDYHIFSQPGGWYNLKVRADFCVEVRLDLGTSWPSSALVHAHWFVHVDMLCVNAKSI